jgi:hypothetical protein
MACKPCLRTGEQLPDNVTCGWVCDAFPACLPPPSHRLLDEFNRLRTQGESHAAVARALEQLYRALIEGLEGRGR